MSKRTLRGWFNEGAPRGPIDTPVALDADLGSVGQDHEQGTVGQA